MVVDTRAMHLSVAWFNT